MESNPVNLPFIVRKDFHSLIGTVKEMQLITTLDEVLAGLKTYIWEKKLFDPQNPFKVYCKNDELGSVLGTEEFTVLDVRAFLSRMVIPVNKIFRDSPEVPSQSVSVHDNAAKRKLDEFFEPDQKKICSEDESSSPMILLLPPSPKSGNSSDSADSLQGYETAFAKDTSDDFVADDSVADTDEIYTLEYEVESATSNDSFSTSSSLSDSESDIAAEVALDAALLTYLCKTDSDIEFFADNSSDEDIEIPQSDDWKCIKCHFFNRPTMRYCSKCWEERLEWLPEKSDMPAKRKRKQRKSILECENKSKEASKSILSSQGSSCSEVKESSSSQQFETGCSSVACEPVPKMCIICCAKPANASIIHGKYAHQISCYKCARMLQKQKKRCPVCRRTIDRVVHQITSI